MTLLDMDLSRKAWLHKVSGKASVSYSSVSMYQIQMLDLSHWGYMYCMQHGYVNSGLEGEHITVQGMFGSEVFILAILQ